MTEKSLDEMCAEMLDSHEGPLGKSFRAPANFEREPTGHVKQVMDMMKGGFTPALPRGTHDVYLDGQGNVEVALPADEPVQKSEGEMLTLDFDSPAPEAVKSERGTALITEEPIQKGGPIGVGKRGGKIYGYDANGKPLYKPSETSGGKQPEGGMSDETEFARRRGLPGVEVKYMHAGKTQDVQLHQMGQMIGWKTTIGSGKRQQVSYHLPEMKKSRLESLDALEAFMKGESVKGTPIGGVTPSGKYKRVGKEEYVEIEKYKMTVTGKGAKEVAKQTEAGIKNSADICKIDPPVCEGNLGIPRKDMPQLPGSVIPKFLEHMQEKKGARVERNAKMKVGQLKATQREINAEKVKGMAASYRAGTFPNIKDAIIVSNDGYILDGHHRWAALLHVSPGETMNVHKVDAPIKTILDEANKFEGVSQQGFEAPSDMKKSELLPLGEALAKGISMMKGCGMMHKACSECEKKDGCDHKDKDGMKKSSLDGLAAMSEYLNQGNQPEKESNMQKSDTGQGQGEHGAKTPGLAALEEYAKSDGGLPTGDHKSLKKPKSQKQGDSADGGSLEGGSAGASEAPDLNSQQGRNASPGKSQKLSEDDAEVEGQMKPHTKPIEKTTKSMTLPMGQRQQVARENAAAASRLRKAQDERLFGQQLTDQVSADMVKSETFYVGGEEPSLHRASRPLEGVVLCKSEQCGQQYSAMLTSCPTCGDGDTQHRVAPGEYLGKSEVRGHQPVLRRPAREEDITVGDREFVRVIRQ